MEIKNELTRLLTQLERIAEVHDELGDTAVREELATAVYSGFIAPMKDFQLPKSFEMFDNDGDSAVRKALAKFLKDACAIADKQGWTEKQRQDAFQDPNVTSEGGLTYDEFFGHAD
jgi:Ca2+-binding EF-hand superfamily protein